DRVDEARPLRRIQVLLVLADAVARRADDLAEPWPRPGPVGARQRVRDHDQLPPRQPEAPELQDVRVVSELASRGCYALPQLGGRQLPLLDRLALPQLQARNRHMDESRTNITA